MLDQVKVDDSHLEVWTLNQEGSGFSVHALVEGKAFGEQEWIWNAPNYKTSLSGVGSSMTSSASLIGPNTIQILNLAMADQITEIQTLRFTASGVEVIIIKYITDFNLLLHRKPMWRPKPMRGLARRLCGRASTQGLINWENLFLQHHQHHSTYMIPSGTRLSFSWGETINFSMNYEHHSVLCK